MTRSILIPVVGFLLVGPAAAQQATPDQGRYQIVPNGDGFVRLDTDTGALAHCDKPEGVWRCTVVDEERTDVDRRIGALQEEIASLRGKLEDFGARLAAIEDSEAPASKPAPAPQGQSSDERDREFDETLSFAERMMQRFFDMIRELKNEEPPQRI